MRREHTEARRTAPGGAAWTVCALVAIGAVAAFGVWLRLNGGGPLTVDLRWHDLVGVAPGSPAFAVAATLAGIGSAMGVTACIAVAAAALAAARRLRDALALSASAILATALSESLKALVARPRPPDALLHPHGLSYPSGHSMGAAVLSVSLVLVVAASKHVSRRAVVWAGCGALAWTLAMMWSRTALHVHWLTDTLAGALLGAASAILVSALLRRGARPEPRR